jgi:hypothetical protein
MMKHSLERNMPASFQPRPSYKTLKKINELRDDPLFDRATMDSHEITTVFWEVKTWDMGSSKSSDSQSDTSGA